MKKVFSILLLMVSSVLLFSNSSFANNYTNMTWVSHWGFYGGDPVFSKKNIWRFYK